MIGAGGRVRLSTPRRLLSATLAIALLPAFVVYAGPAPGQSSSQREAFLRTAEIVAREEVGEGITRPLRVELEQDGVRRSALFKNAEIMQPGSFRSGQERQAGLRDSWQLELAAYELDKLLGLDLVPATVVREIDNTEGALIDWVDDTLPEYGASPVGFDVAAWENVVATVWLFDYIAYNVDRSPANLFVTPGFGVKLIDHSRAFQRFLVPMRPLSRFPREAIERLRRLTEDEIRAPLAPYMTEEELDYLLQRRQRVLERVDTLLRSRPEREVLF